MNKICFVVSQYGQEVNGGAEYHCKMLAEHLTHDFDVDVLTSKTINYKTFEPYYQDEVQELHGVKIRRFDTIAFDQNKLEDSRKQVKFPRKIRKNLFRMGLLGAVSSLIPTWNLGHRQEKAYLKAQGFYSPDLINYLKAHHQDYQAIIFFSYVYPNTVFGIEIAPEKSILIPTVHEESEVFRAIYSHVFTAVKHIGFNTEEERDLTKKIFGNQIADHSTLAIGVETRSDHEPSWEEIKAKFGLPDQYIHYFGRVCESKMEQLIPWFLAYKKAKPSAVKLVLTGSLYLEKIDSPDIIYTGFVSMGEKIALIKNASLVINPSKRESLSLLLLEAMHLKKMVLVNGKSDVLKAHAIKSDYACDYYETEADFIAKLDKYLNNPALVEANQTRAHAYVEENYNWRLIKNRFKQIVNSLV
ncbi:glycosyltransferase [Sphingobacterium humi]|uniref:Glycosyltransferase n=1 Tax=Sphingobacterium humi TaxID=1796905 RepID=A0A6N8L276_9SPHI|nr:glycosyltransferase [Sphingobacterium humi]MVZ62258.1 glycosyltransferase [Sphingobacterium humi]